MINLKYYGKTESERENYIHQHMLEHEQYLKEHYPEIANRVIYIALQGSQNYRQDYYTEDYNSDVDTKAIYIPSLYEMVLNTERLSQTYILPNEEHIDVKDIRLYFDLLKKQNISYIETLVTDFFLVRDSYESFITELRQLADDILKINRNLLLDRFVGVTKQKQENYKKMTPAQSLKVAKYGYDGKNLHHAIRINNLLKMLLADVPLKQALCSNSLVREELRKAKFNEYSLEEADKIMETMVKDTKMLANTYKSEVSLPNIETITKLNELVYTIVLQTVVENEGGKVEYESIKRRF